MRNFWSENTSNKTLNEMKYLFVPYEQAIELKKLGFDEPCFAFYHSNGIISHYHPNEMIAKDYKQNTLTENNCLAPTYEQVFLWLENKHSFYVDRKTITNPNEIMGFEYHVRSYKFEPKYVDFYNNDMEGKLITIKLAINYLQLIDKKDGSI